MRSVVTADAVHRTQRFGPVASVGTVEASAHRTRRQRGWRRRLRAAARVRTDKKRHFACHPGPLWGRATGGLRPRSTGRRRPRKPGDRFLAFSRAVWSFARGGKPERTQGVLVLTYAGWPAAVIAAVFLIRSAIKDDDQTRRLITIIVASMATLLVTVTVCVEVLGMQVPGFHVPVTTRTAAPVATASPRPAPPVTSSPVATRSPRAAAPTARPVRVRSGSPALRARASRGPSRPARTRLQREVQSARPAAPRLMTAWPWPGSGWPGWSGHRRDDGPRCDLECVPDRDRDRLPGPGAVQPADRRAGAVPQLNPDDLPGRPPDTRRRPQPDPALPEPPPGTPGQPAGQPSHPTAPTAAHATVRCRAPTGTQFACQGCFDPQ